MGTYCSFRAVVACNNISGLVYTKDFQVIIEFFTMMNPMQIKLKHEIAEMYVYGNEIKA